MKSKRTLVRVGLSVAVVAGAVLTPAAATSAAPTAPTNPEAPAQEAYDGHLEEANTWALEALNLPAAHETTRGEGVTIAVVDTGMSNHPYFEDKDILPGHSVLGDEEDAWYDISPDSPVAPATAEGNGDDVVDERGHGTAVTSQVLLAAPEATILPVRDGTGEQNGVTNLVLDSHDEIEAIRWAVDNGADVIVTAYGAPGEGSEDLWMAVQYAIDNDVVVLAGAGNEAETPTGSGHPSNFPGLINVSGLAQDGGGWEYSSIGPEVDVAAPADRIDIPVPQSHPHMFESGGGEIDDDDAESVAPPSLYQETNGTSLSVGWIGGVVGLIRAAHPDLDANGVIQRLIQTAGDRGDPGHDPVFGHGVPDAAAALGADVDPVDANPLGYPLGVPGASGVTASGEPAPGTNATGSGTDTDSESGGSDVVPLAVVAVLAVALAGGAWWLLQKRAANAVPQQGAQGAPPPASPPRTALAVAAVVALVVAAGAYVGADALISDGDSGSEAAADSTTTGPSTDDAAAEPGQTGADGNPAALAAEAWQDAYTAGDLEAFQAATCENPWYRVAININKLADPNALRPGFAILSELHDDTDSNWQAADYQLVRQSDGKAWVDAGGTYRIALVMEDGAWKACDFWYVSGSSEGIPEYDERFPR